MNELRIKGISLYLQVENYIRGKITSEEWYQGYKLPAEPELAKQLNVSRSTIRQAIADLVDCGLLVRKHGVGTYVNDSTTYEGDLIMKYLPDDFGKMHQLVSIKVIIATASLAEKLHASQGARLYEIRRIRYLKDEQVPAILETSYLEAKKFPQLHENELTGNVKLYELLNDVYKVQLRHDKSIIEPTTLKKDEAMYLQCEKGQPVLLLTRICSGSDGVPLILTKSLIRPDKCLLVINER